MVHSTTILERLEMGVERSNMKKLLVVDDEIGITEIIRTYFEENGYQVFIAGNADEALERLSEKPDIILLDITMPGTDGIDFCSRIRQSITCPIVFLTARTEERSKIYGLSAGGDDYITKPFSIRELFARVEAHLRRESRPRSPLVTRYFGALWINYSKKEAGVHDDVIDFTKKEYQILEFLSLHGGQVFSHERIYEKIWGYDAQGDANTSVTEHVKRIRKKLEKYDLNEGIETVWGVGYRWKK